MIRRRDFITLLGGAAVAWPLAAQAQQPGKRPIVGFLGDSTPLAESERAAAFARRLHDLGWIEGRTIAIEYRWADGRSDRLAEIAAEFARLKVDIIVTGGTPAVMAAKQAAPVVPIVFAAVGDPVGVGFVASLARPGGNVTGLSALTADLAGKRLELLREVVPGLGRLAIMGNVGNPLTVLELARCRRRPVSSDSSTTRLKSDGRRILHPPWARSKAARTPSMSVKTCSRGAAGCASTPWRWPRACR